MTRVLRTGPTIVLPSPYAVTEAATAAVVACAEAVDALARVRGLNLPPIGVDSRAVAAAITSERHLRIDGVAPAVWAPLSGFVAARDGWARLHGNYPHHAAAIRRALGLAADAGRSALASAVRDRPALEVVEAVVAAGGVAAAVQTPEQWRSSSPGSAALAGELVERRQPLPGRRGGEGTRPLRPARRLPAEGLRVLDLTRVLAGPVAGRTLAVWGAEVLRLDPPQRPEIGWQHVDLDPGKRTALLDLTSATGADRFRDLAGQADVVLLAYRPGSLDGHGVGADDLLARFPHLVVVELSAWGWQGPWGNRRGFDSIVQAASGIATTCAAPDGTPGALPAQVLDHATGYLAAAAAMQELARRDEAGGAHLRLALGHTGHWLDGFGRRDPQEGIDLHAEPYLVEHVGRLGRVRCVRPPFSIGKEALDLPFPARPFGQDVASWASVDA